MLNVSVEHFSNVLKNGSSNLGAYYPSKFTKKCETNHKTYPLLELQFDKKHMFEFLPNHATLDTSKADLKGHE